MLGLGLSIIKDSAGGGSGICYFVNYTADIDTITADSIIESADYSLNLKVCPGYLRVDTILVSVDSTAYDVSATKK